MGGALNQKKTHANCVIDLIAYARWHFYLKISISVLLSHFLLAAATNDHLAFRADNPLWFNTTEATSTDSSMWWNSYAECPLLNVDSDMDKVRIVTELVQLTGAFLYIVAALREMKFLGYHMFIENLVSQMV